MEYKSPDATPRFFYGYIIVAAGFIILITMFSTRYAFGVFFKPLQAEFNWTRAMTSGAFSFSMFAEGLVGIVMGGLNDRLGPRAVLTICGVFLGLGCLLMSQISTIWQLYLFFGIIMGTGMSGAWIPLTSTVARWFIKRRALMSGFVLSGTGLATLTAPPLVNFLISTYKWRFSFIIRGIAVLVIILLAAQFLRRNPSQMGQVPDGAILEERSETEPDAEGFSFREAVFTGQFWLATFMLFCFGFCMFTMIVHMVPHVTDLRIPADTAAKILATTGGIAIIGRLFLGNLADRIGSRRIFIIGFIVLPLAFLWLIPAEDVWKLYLFALAFGFVQGGMGACESPLVAEIFGLKSHGTIYGVVGFGFTLGGAVGPWFGGFIYDETNSYRMAFAACVVTGIIGLILTILIKQIKNRKKQFPL